MATKDEQMIRPVFGSNFETETPKAASIFNTVSPDSPTRVILNALSGVNLMASLANEKEPFPITPKFGMSPTAPLGSPLIDTRSWDSS